MDKEWHSFGNKSLATACAIRHFHPPMGKDWVCDNLCFKKKANYDSIRTEEPFNWDCYKKKASTMFHVAGTSWPLAETYRHDKNVISKYSRYSVFSGFHSNSRNPCSAPVRCFQGKPQPGFHSFQAKSHNWIPCFVTSSHLSPHPFPNTSVQRIIIVLTGYLQDCWLNN